MNDKMMIEDIKVGVSEGGIACGPVSGHVVAEACIRNLVDDSVMYYSLAEVEGTLNFTLMEESTFDGQIQENYDDTDFWDRVSAHEDGGYSDYGEFYADLDSLEMCTVDRKLIWKYLAYMVRASWKEVDCMKAASVGKCLGDFDIPVCDVEQEYLDEREDEGARE